MKKVDRFAKDYGLLIDAIAITVAVIIAFIILTTFASLALNRLSSGGFGPPPKACEAAIHTVDELLDAQEQFNSYATVGLMSLATGDQDTARMAEARLQELAPVVERLSAQYQEQATECLE